MACIDFLIWIGTPKKRSVTVEEVDGEKKIVYKPARYSSINGYIKEAMELGCCRRIPQLPYWAVPGRSRVFLVHRGNHKRLERGSIFGYYVLKRIEFISKQSSSSIMEQCMDGFPWSNKFYLEFKKRVQNCKGAADQELCVRNRWPERLKHDFPREVCKRKIEFPYRFPENDVDDSDDPFVEMVNSVFRDQMNELSNELMKKLHRKLHWIPASLLAGGKWLAVRRGKGACLNRAFSCITVSWGLEGLNMPYMI